ncbi:MAG TPA: hypothetical protein VH682_20515 [Gemmataceae bacterium]
MPSFAGTSAKVSRRPYFDHKTGEWKWWCNMSETAIVPWTPMEPMALAPTAEPPEIVQRALLLTERDQKAIVQAFQSGAFEMASTFVWSRAIAALKKQLAHLGMEFIGEMLGRTDLDESSNPMTDIRDDEAIELAEQLGMVTTTEALRLRTGQTLVNHFLDPAVSQGENMLSSEATTIIRSCVLNFLAEPVTSSQQPFLKLREKLERETLDSDSNEAKALEAAPYFYVRTTLTVLLTQLKNAAGAKLEHAAGNINSLLPCMWPKLRDKDKWQTGETYATVQAAGRQVASAGLRAALMKVRGFDFVPESLRSDSFRAAARAVLSAHFAYDNFYNEPKPMATLAKLGTSIPGPALADCFTAVLCVRLGNPWGYSRAAQASAGQFLKLIRPSQWEGYFNRLLPSDRRILEKIGYDEKPLVRWQELIGELNIDDLTIDPRVAKMISSDRTKKVIVQKTAQVFRNKLMQDT